jgi:HAD superfamily hydrolase (TIGR01509 family)
MKELKALLFDVDGTLADTEDGHLIAFNHTFEQYGLNWSWSEELYDDLLSVTGGRERIRFYIDQYNPDFERPDDLDAFIRQLHKDKTEYFVQLMREGGIPLRPGVKRLIQEAREQGVRLAIATTTSPENVEALLVSAMDPSAMSWFEVIAAGDMVPAKKPAPDVYLYALEKLGLGPDECIALEDSGNGIRSSLGAGINTIIATNKYTHGHDFSGAVIVLDQWGEPDQPFTVLSGDAGSSTYLDMELVRRLHAA